MTKFSIPRPTQAAVDATTRMIYGRAKMTDAQTLNALADRLEAGETGNENGFRIDLEISICLSVQPRLYSTSLDAVLALHNEIFPGKPWEIGYDGDAFYAAVPPSQADAWLDAEAKNPAAAMCAVDLRAKAQEASGG